MLHNHQMMGSWILLQVDNESKRLNRLTHSVSLNKVYSTRKRDRHHTGGDHAELVASHTSN